jgi:hypothetical protein
MPTYPVVNAKTGETKEFSMSILEYAKWKIDNKDWDKDWSKGCAGIGEVGDWRNKLISKHPSWNTVLENVSKAPKSKVKKI